ncbi:MAG: archaeosortase/exosortase family protein [Desulfurococcaceae archaeon]
MSQYLWEYRFKLVIGYLVILSILAVFIQTTYKEYIESILRLIFTEDYSYLIVSFLTIILVLYLSLRYMGFTYEIQVSRIIVSILLFVLSLILYRSSAVFLEYTVFLMGTSFSLVLIALLILIFKPLTMADTIPMLIPLLMIPVPASVLDFLTPVLSRFIGKLAAVFTQTRFVESGAFAFIEVEINGSIYTFSVEAACSGILTISSIIVVFPLLAYYASVSHEKPLRKIAVSISALVAGLLTGIVGNLLRVVLIILVAKHYNIDLAMSIFHYSPSIIYATLSVLISYALINKYAKIRYIIPRPLLKDTRVPYINWEYITGVLAVVVLISIAIQVATIVVAYSSLSNQSIAGIVVRVDSFEEFTSNPSKYVFTGSARIANLIYDPFLTRAIGSLSTYRVAVMVNDTMYIGFLEVVDIPARLHTLQLCVSLQGYRVLNTWSESNGTIRIGYMLMEKDGVEYLLAYLLTPVIIKTPVDEHVVYARISLIRPHSKLADFLYVSSALFSTLNYESMIEAQQDDNLYLLGVLGVVLFIVLVIYVSAIYVSSYISRFARGWR